MKKMTKKKKLFRKVTALAAVIALGASLAGCGSFGGETLWMKHPALFLAAGNGEPGGHGNADLR